MPQFWNILATIQFFLFSNFSDCFFDYAVIDILGCKPGGVQGLILAGSLNASALETLRERAACCPEHVDVIPLVRTREKQVHIAKGQRARCAVGDILPPSTVCFCPYGISCP